MSKFIDSFLPKTMFDPYFMIISPDEKNFSH